MSGPATHLITIHRSRPLASDPGIGHNRWHPDIPPTLSVELGETIALETRDAYDGQIAPSTTTADLKHLDANRIHPLTGPVHVRGAEPGDILTVEIVEVTPQTTGFSIASPHFGILRKHLPESLLVHWFLAAGFATSPQLPNVYIPAEPFMGLMGVAPSHAMLARFRAMEERICLSDPLLMWPVEPAGAIPAVAGSGLRTIPPRDNGGNIDVRQLTAGAVLRLPVSVEGALFSCGDAHYAQGDNECCTGIEMGATLICRFGLRKREAAKRSIRDVQFSRPAGPPLAQRPIFATTGQSYARDSTLRRDDLDQAAEHALLNMIAHLSAEYGYTVPQAAVVCSVAVDLRISQAANTPNYVVSAILPTDIFVC